MPLTQDELVQSLHYADQQTAKVSNLEDNFRIGWCSVRQISVFRALSHDLDSWQAVIGCVTDSDVKCSPTCPSMENSLVLGPDHLTPGHASDSQGSASGHPFQRPLPPVSLADSQGMSFFTRFCSRWNATRTFLIGLMCFGTLKFNQISLPPATQWYPVLTVYIASTRLQSYKSSHFTNRQTLPPPIYSYSPRQGHPFYQQSFCRRFIHRRWSRLNSVTLTIHRRRREPSYICTLASFLTVSQPVSCSS